VVAWKPSRPFLAQMSKNYIDIWRAFCGRLKTKCNTMYFLKLPLYT
jgi:hypothetical protein